MLNRKSVFGLVAAVALVSFPVAASAQQTGINSQSGGNSGVTSGTGNVVDQNVDQDSIQQQQSVDPNQYLHGGGTDPQLEVNQQKGTNSGAAIGKDNVVDQNVDQNSLQQQYGVGH
jgi:hypothetical protein